MAVVVALAGSLVSVAVWAMLVLDRHERAIEDTREIAQAISRTIEDHLARQHAELAALARSWGEEEVERSAVDRLFATGLTTGVTTGAGLEELSIYDITSSEPVFVRRRAARASAPRADDGSPLYEVKHPILEDGHPAAMLVARIDPEIMLGQLLRARALHYTIDLRRNDARGNEVPIYQRGVDSERRAQSWWRVDEPIELPTGSAWTMTYRPTPEYASTRLNAIPHLVLMLGLGLSACLALLLYELRRTLGQSRSLASTNRALEERGDELMRLNEELEKRVSDRTQELEDAVVELRAFNYSVSHDLRSPLGAILNFASILEEDYADRPLDAAGVALIERIIRSADRATLLIENLLQLSRASRAELHLEEVDMTRLATAAFRQTTETEDATNVELRIDPLPSARCDPQLVGSVFANLFSNALKYSRGREKRRISVHGERQAGEAVYTVTDNGRGFDIRFAPKLFQVFERLHHDDEIEGTGVGLAIVARIIKRHGGRIWGSGELDHGARFSFALPVEETQ